MTRVTLPGHPGSPISPLTLMPLSALPCGLAESNQLLNMSRAGQAELKNQDVLQTPEMPFKNALFACFRQTKPAVKQATFLYISFSTAAFVNCSQEILALTNKPL